MKLLLPQAVAHMSFWLKQPKPSLALTGDAGGVRCARIVARDAQLMVNVASGVQKSVIDDGDRGWLGSVRTTTVG
jgi:hypothetical protein